MRDGYYIKADGAIVFYDIFGKDRSTFFEYDFLRVCPESPIIRVWGKYDNEDQMNEFENIKEGLDPIHPVSSLTCHNLEKPILLLLQNLTNDESLEILDELLEE